MNLLPSQRWSIKKNANFLSSETDTCAEMSADKDAAYDESTDEECENVPDAPLLTSGKINTFISLLSI